MKKPYILFEDNQLVAVYKPSGWLTQGDVTGARSLMDWTRDFLREKYQKRGNVFLGLLHRLDRVAQGVVVFAKTSKAASRLSEQLRNRRVVKIYRAWVGGRVTENGVLKNHILRKENRSVVVGENMPHSQSAILQYKPLGSARAITLLEIRLHTGRKHQIRCQLSQQGWPIVGDSLYGSKMKWMEKEGIGLLGKRMEFMHPTRPEKVVIEIQNKEFECH